MTVSKESKESAGGGIGFTGALFLVFLVLKLLGKISWSWWWVTSPLWGSLALVLCIFAACIGIAVAWAALDHMINRRRR